MNSTSSTDQLHYSRIPSYHLPQGAKLLNSKLWNRSLKNESAHSTDKLRTQMKIGAISSPLVWKSISLWDFDSRFVYPTQIWIRSESNGSTFFFGVGVKYRSSNGRALFNGCLLSLCQKEYIMVDESRLKRVIFLKSRNRFWIKLYFCKMEVLQILVETWNYLKLKVPFRDFTFIIN